MNRLRFVSYVLLLMAFQPVMAEISPSIPPTAELMQVVTTESEVKGIFFDCELYSEAVTSTTVFFKICRVKGSGKSVVQITSYEKYFEEVVIWAAEGFTVE